MTAPAAHENECVTIRTVGHGTLSAEDFASLVVGADVDLVVDVRAFPGSRHNPQFGRQEMEQWVPTAGIGYVWNRELGGRRRNDDFVTMAGSRWFYDRAAATNLSCGCQHIVRRTA